MSPEPAVKNVKYLEITNFYHYGSPFHLYSGSELLSPREDNLVSCNDSFAGTATSTQPLEAKSSKM